MATTSKANDPSMGKSPPGASWRDKDEQVLPQNRLGIVSIGLMCCLFLAALDQTVVATALPTIVADIGGGSAYNWVGSAYMLAGGAFGPLYGKLSVLFGRKPILYSSIFMFLIGSAMCGAAQSMTWLIASRVIQGVGSSGIMQLVVIILSDIVPLKDQGRYGGLFGSTYGIASVVGPLLGGVFADHISWRWCFFINLPTGCIAAIILVIFLNLNPHQGRPIRDELAEFDFIGLFCFVTGVVCLLMGLHFGETTWSRARTVVLLVTGIVLLVVGGINEMFTTRSAILPARLFKTRTTTFILITVFIHAIIFFSISYYLPLFYQVLGASATSAGIKMLPYSLTVSLISIVAGYTLSKIGKYRLIIWAAYVLMTLGVGLMVTLDYSSSIAVQEIFPLIAAVGIGSLLQVPLVAVQAAMPRKDVPTASGGFMFIRSVGGAVGISISEAIIANALPGRLFNIPNFARLGLGTTVAQLNDNIGAIRTIPNVTMRNAVMHGWSRAIGTIWTVSTPLSGLALILTLFLREYSLDRKTVQSGESKAPAGDPEKNTGGVVGDGEDLRAAKPLEEGPSTRTDTNMTNGEVLEKGKRNV